MYIEAYTELSSVAVYSLPRKKVYTFVEPSTQNWGVQMKSRGFATPTFELVQTGPSLIWTWMHWTYTPAYCSVFSVCIEYFKQSTFSAALQVPWKDTEPALHFEGGGHDMPWR